MSPVGEAWCFYAYRVLGCSVQEAKRRTSYKEFVRFRLYRASSPWGDDWDQTGVIAATVANGNRTKGKAYEISDFRPNYKRPISDEKRDAEIENKLRTFFGAGSDG